jgi:hypothetical protein
MEGTTVMNHELDPMPDDAESGPLSNLTIVELRGLWRQLYGSEPQPSINRSLLIKRIACKSQEQTLFVPWLAFHALAEMRTRWGLRGGAKAIRTAAPLCKAERSDQSQVFAARSSRERHLYE